MVTADPRLIETAAGPLVGVNTQSSTGDSFTILDNSWAKMSFLMSDSSLAHTEENEQIASDVQDDIANRYWSSAARKFTDTRMGGNTAVNARPQFNRYADVRIKGRYAGRADVTVGATTGNHGMGRYYSEAIDDNAQTVYLRFGVPQYNSLFSFFTNAFNPGMASLVNTGQAKGWAYTAGQIVGTVFTAVAFPVLTTAVVGARIISKFFSRATSKFYTMKPTMFLYWAAVDMLVNSLVINRGLMPKFPGGDQSTQRIGDPFNFDAGFINDMHARFPEIFNEQGRVDIYAVALKAQRMANQVFLKEYEQLNSGDPSSFEGYVRNEGATGKTTIFVTPEGNHTLISILAEVSKLQSWFNIPNDSDRTLTSVTPKIDPVTGQHRAGTQEDGSNPNPSWAEELITYLDAELSQGGAFAVFKVDSTGAASESFSNSVMESDLSQKLNQSSSTARQMSFTFAGGNLGDGLIANALEAGVTGIKDIVAGAASGLTLGFSDGLHALLAGSYYDIPKTWQSSTATLPRANYTIQLVAPYGHPFSQLQNIYIPFCMLLASVLPRSTGKQTYGAPFLCQVYDRGRCQIQLGMVESLSITRGTSNLTFNRKGQPMAVDVTFSVVDLSSIMHMPMGTGTIWEFISQAAGNTLPMMDEDNILMDYMAVVAGLDIYNQIYPLPKARLQAARMYTQASKYSSSAYWASAIHDSATSGVLSYTPLGVGMNALELGSRGSDVVTGPNR